MGNRCGNCIFLGSKITADGTAAMKLKDAYSLEEKRIPSQSLGEGNGNPLHYSCLENPMDRGAW